MKFSQKIMLFVLSLAFVAVSLDAAKRQRDDSDDEAQPSVPKRQQVTVGQATGGLAGICNAAQARLEEQFPTLVGGAGPSSPPAITAEQLTALQGAAGALKMATAFVGGSSGVFTRVKRQMLADFNKLADDTIDAIRSVVLNSRADLTALAEAIDGYNDACGRAVARLRDAAIANENGQFRYSDEEIAAYDSHIPEILLAEYSAHATTALPKASSAGAGASASGAGSDDATCPICFDDMDFTSTAEEQRVVSLICKTKNTRKDKQLKDPEYFTASHSYHGSCISAYFTQIMNRLDMPTCPKCKAAVDSIPDELKGLVPEIKPENLLFAGALNGSVDFVTRALAMGVNVNTINTDAESMYHTYTALHIAAACGYTAVVRLLLNHGADREARTDDNETPLHLAAEEGSLEVVAFLCNNGVDKEASDDYGETALHSAAANGHLNVVEFLWNNGANKEAQNGSQWTPLHCAADNGYHHVVAFLCNNDADKEARSENDETPLHLAAGKGKLEAVKILWNNGADREARDDSNETALHSAAANGHLNVVEFLWNNGADREARDANNRTALHLAVRVGNQEIVAFLWNNGADREARDAKNCTALHLAAYVGNREIVEFLWNNGADREARAEKNCTALHLAVQKGYCAAVVEFLWNNRADREARDAKNCTALHLAAYFGNREIVEFLWNNGADREARAEDNSTALHLAVRKGYCAVVEFLCNNGADKEARAEHNSTALHLAVKHGQLVVIAMLISQGADIKAKITEGKTALDLAKEAERARNQAVYAPIVRALEAADEVLQAAAAAGYNKCAIM